MVVFTCYSCPFRRNPIYQDKGMVCQGDGARNPHWHLLLVVQSPHRPICGMGPSSSVLLDGCEGLRTHDAFRRAAGGTGCFYKSRRAAGYGSQGQFEVGVGRPAESPGSGLCVNRKPELRVPLSSVSSLIALGKLGLGCGGEEGYTSPLTWAFLTAGGAH